MTCSRNTQIEVAVTALPLIADFMIPSLMQVARTCPQVSFRYRPSVAAGALAPGGAGPAMPQVVIGLHGSAGPPDGAGIGLRRLGVLRVGLYATEDYIARYGRAQQPADLAAHALVHHDREGDIAPWEQWLTAHVPDAPVALRSNDEAVQRAAVRSGHCAGFMPVSSLLWNLHFRAVMASRPEWAAALWMAAPTRESLPEPAGEAVEMLGGLLSRCLSG